MLQEAAHYPDFGVFWQAKPQDGRRIGTADGAVAAGFQGGGRGGGNCNGNLYSTITPFERNRRLPESMKTLPYWLLSLAVVAADQISKFAVLERFALYERLNVIDGFFDLTLVYNPGAAFSFLANMGGAQRYIFVVLAFAISIWLGWNVVKGGFGRLGNWAAMMIIGGAMGNVIDRFLHGQVVDFLLFYWQNHYYPAFNVADSFICVGAFLLVLESFAQGRKNKGQAA